MPWLPHFIYAQISFPDEETVAGQCSYVEEPHWRAGVLLAFWIITSFVVCSGHAETQPTVCTHRATELAA